MFSWGKSIEGKGLLLFIFFCGCFCFRPMAEGGVETLPLKKVILYKHGVGYFERRGVIKGDDEIVLRFKASQMSDVLKSITVLDLGQGSISFISYDSQPTPEKRLSEISIRLPDKDVLTSLITQLKGAKVEVEIGSHKLLGTIIGTESVSRKERDAVITVEQIVLFKKDGKVSSYNMAEVKSIKFLDKDIITDLKELFDVLMSAKRKDLKRLSIHAAGKGERQIVIGYTVETPVWKTSYRVVFDKDKKPLLQGWAIVDNTTEEDWNEVSLSLISGLPVSFQHDLYSPRYQKRPVLEVKEKELFEIPEPEASKALDLEEEVPSRLFFKHKEKKTRALAPPSEAPLALFSQARRESIDVKTITAELGELFEYTIARPVTVKKNSSSLVPILQEEFDGEKVAVFNPEIRQKNPMAAVLFKNSTGLTLEGGPVTVIEDGIYVGEAMLDTMRPKDEQYIPYSVELGCVVMISDKSKSERVHMAKIVNGYLYLYNYNIAEKIYDIHNKTEKPISLVLEHRYKKGWNLVDTQKPIDKTENFYRFRIELKPEEKKRFCVKEKGKISSTYHVVSLDNEQVELFVKRNQISKEMHEFLLKVNDIRGVINLIKGDIDRCKKEIKRIFSNQSRIRDNLQALGMSSQEQSLRERYIAKLNREEDRLEQLQNEIEKLEKKKKHLQSKLKKMLDEFKLEKVF